MQNFIMKIEIENLHKTIVTNRWLWHLGFWLFYFFIRLRPYYNTVLFYDKLFLKYMLSAEILFLLTTYITIYLFNSLLPKKKHVLFFISGFITWLIYVIGDVHLKKYFLDSLPNFANYKKIDMFLDTFSYYIIFYIFIVLLKYFKNSFINQYNQNIIIKQQMQFELENLKAQISPHFLFNTMNNFYGLAVENSEKLPNLMIRLSNLLRYSLYETKHEKVPLENEILYLENYVELEKIRLEDNLNLLFRYDKSIAESFQIAPLLLITFVENAFKHSKNSLDPILLIEIIISIEANGNLNMSIKNSYNRNVDTDLSSKKGIGLENVKKRLEAIYQNDKYNLTIFQDDSFFTIKLFLNLN